MVKSIHLRPLPAFTDNYIWLIHDGRRAVVVDPGQAEPVERALQAHQLTLESIVITHHHPDHTGGVCSLKQHTGARVYGPAAEQVACMDVGLRGGDEIDLLGLPCQVMAVPGHTVGHLAYYVETVVLSDTGETVPLLFCGDTLFSAGSGRLFEGTPAQMLSSLDTLAALPFNTRVCAGHEYTLANMRFAAAVEPENSALRQAYRQAQHLRSQGIPTLPSSLALELEINPFLRSRTASVRHAVATYAGHALKTDAEWFAALREWKNAF